MVVFSAIDKKLFRDLWRLRGQVLAIALVIGSGVATLVMSLSTVDALRDTTEAYYERYKFADVFAYATRAPERLAKSLSEIPGVQTVDTRITEYVTVDIADFAEPVVGQLLSIPENNQPLLNQLVLRTGRWVAPGRSDEIIVSEPFAQAHGIPLYGRIDIIMDGNKRQFRVVGTALSPEFIYAISPGGLMPDDERFGVMWLARDVLEAAFDLDASFNSIALKLMHNASTEQVLLEIDTLLEPYGGISSIDRKDQISNWFVMNEIEQQKSMARILPSIFIVVSVFLTNMVLSRLIATERTEIGLLKAFGYSGAQIAWQYAKLVLLICLIGFVIGCTLGYYLGRENSQIFTEMYRFPLFVYEPRLSSYSIGGLITTVAVLIGAYFAVRAAIKLPPAQAMIPPSPPVYSQSLNFNTRYARWLDQPTRIALRQIRRWPLRSFLTSFGVALSCGLIIMNMQWTDSLDYLQRVYFEEAQKQDMMVGVPNPVSMRAIHDFENLPGVIRAEPMRIISADISAGGITHRGAISGIEKDSTLQPVYDASQEKVVPLPSNGLMMATRLAQKLKVDVGDEVWVEVLEGKRKTFSLPVAGVFETYIGTPTYLEIGMLNRYMGESPSFEYANILVDGAKQDETFNKLKETPKITAVMLRQAAADSFDQIIVEHLLVLILMFVFLACILTFGVVYNSTRVALSERARELATLRVLGFTRGEISYVLLGEVMFMVLFGLPLGCLCGWILVLSMASAFDTEMFRVPLVIELSTYGIAATLVIVAAGISAAIVRRRVDTLDLIKVLKTRE
ncbi:ABC transporter permease [Ningiella sp. W23]|uniref:ABC transporter permease n=1 Tax=Ningiella sp. W23 TaxID=3023715 RepID=UPI003756866D